MRVKNPPNFLVTTDGRRYAIKIIASGAWNMDSTQSRTIPHGLNIEKVFNIEASVINDAKDRIFALETSSSALAANGYVFLTATDVVFNRLPGSIFDSVDFDDAVMNRGYARIGYVLD
jgi:hypothetical protein